MADLRVLEGVKIVDADTPANSVQVTANGELTAILAANSGVDIGDVDVTSVIPGTGATNLGKAENAASAGGDTLVGSAAVQDAVLSPLGSIDGDYTWIRVNANGALWVEDVNDDITFDAAETEDDDDSIAFAQTSLRAINLLYGSDGSAWERVRTDGSGALHVAIQSGGGESLPTNPVRSTSSSTDTAAGATHSLDGPESGGTTTTTRGFDCAASVPIKVELQTVADGTPTTILSLFGGAGERVEWRAPHRDFFDTAHPANAGFDGFRLLLTNLDNENAANLYATLYTED